MGYSNSEWTPPIAITALPVQTAVASPITTANVLLVSVQLIAANPLRKGFIIWNNSANSCYVCLAATANSSACAKIIATFTSWEWMYPVAYTGPISAIRNAGSGSITVWEMT